MVKHTQTIRWLLQINCLSVFDHFVGLTLKGLNLLFVKIQMIMKLIHRNPTEKEFIWNIHIADENFI